MSHRRAFGPSTSCRWLRATIGLTLLTALAACGGRSTRYAHTHYNPSRYYPPPGPASDPWGPYIHEASGRYGVPENWIRRVMRQESGGQQDVISWAGAIGLMQVMPETYDGLRSRYNLGADPFDPHNNILAGTAYLREMYDRFGAPAFLAAYNAGPNRVDRYLTDGTPLPAETVQYVASIAPLLRPGTPMSSPLAVYAGHVPRAAVYAGLPPRMAGRPTPAGCDPDAAYNPDGPCTPLRPAAEPSVVVAASAPAYAPSPGPEACDPDAAYDPARPCQPVSTAPAYASSQGLDACDPDAAYDPTRRCRPVSASTEPVVAEPLQRPMADRPTRYASRRPIQEIMARPVAFAAAAPTGHWAIQVGAFATLPTALAAAENARSELPDMLRTAKIALPPTARLGRQVAFRARLSGLTSATAMDACARLSGRGRACITVPPGRNAS